MAESCGGPGQNPSALLDDGVDDALGDVDHDLADSLALAVELPAGIRSWRVLELEQLGGLAVVDVLQLAAPS